MMATARSTPQGHAPGAPGLPPNWASARKTGVGTARNNHSRVWFTLADGIVTECYYPRVDTPDLRDLQFLVLDPQGKVLEERRDLRTRLHWIEEGVPAYRIVSDDPEGRFSLIKEICTDPEGDTLLIRLRFTQRSESNDPYRLFLLVAPQIGNHGMSNRASCEYAPDGRSWCAACREGIHIAVTGSVPFQRMSAGYVGASDGWQDLHHHRDMRWTFAKAGPGHVALMAEMDIAEPEQTLVLAFGTSQKDAREQGLRSLQRSFPEVLS